MLLVKSSPLSQLGESSKPVLMPPGEGFISGHSLRGSNAVSLTQLGASVVDRQIAGRWQLPQMPAHYAKAEFTERGAMARFFYGKAK